MKKAALIAVAAMALTPMPSVAHHSFAMFDLQETIALEGTVHRFKWQNPHAWLQVDVGIAGGGSERWAIEMTSPNNLALEGWRRTTVRTGDSVTLYVHPLRNGAKGGSFSGVRLANGETLGTVE